MCGPLGYGVVSLVGISCVYQFTHWKRGRNMAIRQSTCDRTIYRGSSRSRRRGGRLGKLAASVLLMAGSFAVSTATPANAAGCDNYAPVKANVVGPWGKVGIVQLSYNPCNRNVWGYIVTGWPPCQSNGLFCAAVIVTQSTGNRMTCSTPVGANSCNTPQASDANITSYADGYIVWGTQPQKTATGRTGRW